MKERLEYVDIAKGIGIVLVVCSHSDALDLMWLMMGMFVPIFYFCSGYTYVKKGTLIESVKKRYRKLFVPYIFFNVVMLFVFGHFSIRELVGIIYSRYSLYPLDVSPNLKFLTSGNYPMWFLTSMIVTYILFCFIVYFERYKYTIILGLALLTIVMTMCPILLPWSLDTAPLTAMIMYIGMEIRRRGLMSMSHWKVLLLSLLYVGLQCIGGDINLSVRMYGNSVAIYFVLAVLGSFILLWASKYLEGTLLGKCFFTLGHHSLTIFCIEMAFIVWAKSLYQWLFPQSELNYFAGLFEIVLALFGGWKVSVMLHKNKCISSIAYGS